MWISRLKPSTMGSSISPFELHFVAHHLWIRIATLNKEGPPIVIFPMEYAWKGGRFLTMHPVKDADSVDHLLHPDTGQDMKESRFPQTWTNLSELRIFQTKHRFMTMNGRIDRLKSEICKLRISEQAQQRCTNRWLQNRKKLQCQVKKR